MSIQAINEVKRRTIPGGQKAKHVLIHLADYANADWTCWPSSERISAETQIPIRTLARVMGALREAGIITTERRQVGQVRTSDLIIMNHAALLTLPLAGVDGPEHATVAHAEMASSSSEHAISDTENMPFRAEIADLSSIKNHQKNHQKDHATDVSPVTSTPKPYDDPDFRFFWSIYPRKDDKFAAWTKWRSVRKTTPADDIIQGCERYAAKIAAEGTEREFVKLGATWLNKRCWENEYALEVIPIGRNRSKPALAAKADQYTRILGHAQKELAP